MLWTRFIWCCPCIESRGRHNCKHQVGVMPNSAPLHFLFLALINYSFGYCVLAGFQCSVDQPIGANMSLWALRVTFELIACLDLTLKSFCQFQRYQVLLLLLWYCGLVGLYCYSHLFLTAESCMPGVTSSSGNTCMDWTSALQPSLCTVRYSWKLLEAKMPLGGGVFPIRAIPFGCLFMLALVGSLSNETCS